MSILNDKPWLRSIVWLMFLAPFFFLSYGFANDYAAQQSNVPSLYFEWEKNIPFIPWMILPYWSLDLLYGLSFLCCRTSRQVDIHALRLLSIQVVSVVCFILFPLKFAWSRPISSGIFQTLFDILMGFDLPFNQAPSLHISLTVAITACFALSRISWIRYTVYVLAGIIIISVLTTFQHHFIDIPTGLLLGFSVLWLLPFERPTRRVAKFFHPKLGTYYLLGAIILGVLSYISRPLGLWLIWPAVALLLVSCNYFFLGSAGFQKHHGKHSIAVTVLALPYLVTAKLNAYYWTRNKHHAYQITDQVSLGSLIKAPYIQPQQTLNICDMSAEIALPKSLKVNHYFNYPILDLTLPDIDTLRTAAQSIEILQQKGPTLVCCALGFSRSALAILAWLVLTRRCQTVTQAHELLKRQAPHCVISPEALSLLEQL